MSQTNSNRQKQFIAVGGFVVGASAAAVVFASYNFAKEEDRKSSWIRGSSSQPSSLVPISESGSGSDGGSTARADDGTASSVQPKIFHGVSLNTTALAAHVTGAANASNVAVADLISSVNTAVSQGNDIPSPVDVTYNPTTYSPTVDVKFPTLMPTYAAQSVSSARSTSFPTYSPTAYAEFPTFMPTELNLFSPRFMPKKRTYSGLHRLKLYWEVGYYWQESENEKVSYVLLCSSHLLAPGLTALL
jgi:hypothetical protein